MQMFTPTTLQLCGSNRYLPTAICKYLERIHKIVGIHLADISFDLFYRPWKSAVARYVGVLTKRFWTRQYHLIISWSINWDLFAENPSLRNIRPTKPGALFWSRHNHLILTSHILFYFSPWHTSQIPNIVFHLKASSHPSPTLSRSYHATTKLPRYHEALAKSKLVFENRDNRFNGKI